MLTKTWPVSMVVVLVGFLAPLLASDTHSKPLPDHQGGCLVFESFREVFYPVARARRAWEHLWTALLARPLVTAVVVQGNQRVPLACIVEQIHTKPGNSYEQATIDADVRRVFDMQEFANVQVQRHWDEGRCVVTFVVAEYPQTKLIKDIEYLGVTRFSLDELEFLAGLCRGRPAPRLAADIQREIERCYNDLGLFDARVERLQVQEEDGIRLIFAVQEGAPCRVCSVDLQVCGQARRLGARAEAWLLAHPTTAGLIGSPFDEALAERVVAVLEECYQCNGFPNVHVSCGVTPHPERGGKLAITILDLGISDH